MLARVCGITWVRKSSNMGTKVQNMGTKVQNIGTKVQNITTKIQNVGSKVQKSVGHLVSLPFLGFTTARLRVCNDPPAVRGKPSQTHEKGSNLRLPGSPA